MSEVGAARIAGVIAGLGIAEYNKRYGKPDPHISWTNLVPGWVEPQSVEQSAWYMGFTVGKHTAQQG